MAGMPYPPNLCLPVGGFLCQKVLCVPRVLWDHSLCLLCWCCRGSCTSVVVFSHGIHGIHGMLGCVIGGVGMAGMPYPPNLCASVPICGRHFSARRFCVFRVFCGTLSLFALLVHLWAAHLRWFPSAARSDCVRRPIRLRPPSDQIASATRSDSVRHPIRFRPLHDAISRVCILRRLRCNTQCVYVLHPFMFAKLRNKFDF